MVSVDIKHHVYSFPTEPVPNSLHGLCGRAVTPNLNFINTELGNCVKVEVVVMGSLYLIVLNNYGLCGRKATLNFTNTELSRCIKVDVVVPVLGSLSLIVLMVRVGVKQH